MNNRRTQATTPIDRPFPDENTVAEMYCNEAYTVDNEAVEDWTSSLQMLLTFAAIFSAVLITLIVKSRTLLEQNKTDVLIDAVVFLVNNLANDTHRPYTPPAFQPSTQSILVNCFFFSSLCLSIATALAAVLAMQWVTDYSAVTRRPGSTPEERVKRRHFRYQGAQDWGMDTVIGALPIALHLSVLLFFAGLIVWMWDVHHSVFAVVVVCGAVAALFYVVTTVMAIFCPSCPYRTPLASWIYTLLHFLAMIIFPSSWFALQKQHSENDVEMGEATEASRLSKLRQFLIPFLSRLAPSSLTSRDDIFIRNPDHSLMATSLVWLSRQLPISPDIYRRLLVFVDGFSSIVDPRPHLSVVPWREMLRVLGMIYQSFVEALGMKEEEFVEFSRRTYCLNEPALKEIFALLSGGSEGAQVGSSDFPIHFLYAWTKSTSSHNSDTLRKQRYSDEVIVRDLINSVSATPQELVETWYGLLEDEAKTITGILPKLLGKLESGTKEQMEQRRDATLYLISTRRLPWDSTVPIAPDGIRRATSLPPNSLARKLRVIDWVDRLNSHPQKQVILKHLSGFTSNSNTRIVSNDNKLGAEEEIELKRMGLDDLSRWTRTEETFYRALLAFDQILDDTADQEEKRNLMLWMVMKICWELGDLGVTLNPEHLNVWRVEGLRRLLNPVLRLIACATLEIDWRLEWTQGLLEAKHPLTFPEWQSISLICFKKAPFSEGDHTALWRLRLRLWIHFDPGVTFNYLNIYDVNGIKDVQQEIQATQLEVDNAGDFFLALYHFNVSKGWISDPSLYTFIPDMLIGDVASVTRPRPRVIQRESTNYLFSICEEINADPMRLIRLLIELIRADIGSDPRYRRPQNLLNLLKHAESLLTGKEIQPFAPSLRRLTRYIRASYRRFGNTWEEILSLEYKDPDLVQNYKAVDRGELKSVYKRVIALLKPEGTWDGEEKDISWPGDLLHPREPDEKLFREDIEEDADSQNLEEDGNHGKEDREGNQKMDSNEDKPQLSAQPSEDPLRKDVFVLVEESFE